MRLRIASDGTAAGTRVETEDGHVLDGVQAITFTMVSPGLAQAMLIVEPVQCEIVVDSTWTHKDHLEIDDIVLTTEELNADSSN